MASDWVRDDYILHGTPCPRTNIRDLLEIARLVSGNDCLILASIDERSVLKKLCMVADEDTDRGRRLEERLQAKTLVQRIEPTDADHRVIAEDLHGLLELDDEGHDLSSVFATGHGLDSRQTALGLVILAIGSPARRVGNRWLQELHLRINATIYADIRRDHQAARRVQLGSNLRAKKEQMGETIAQSYLRSIDALLQLMLDVTGGDGAAYYRLDGPSARLRREKSVPAGVDCPLPQDAPYRVSSTAERKEGPSHAQTPDAEVSEIARFLGQSLNSASIMLTSDTVEHDGEEAYLEIVSTAVPAIALGRDNANQGVIALWSLDRSARRFDRSQLGWLRNVALRLALLETSFEAEESASKISFLSGKLARPASTELEADLPVILDGEPLPFDLCQVVDSWQELVERVRDATRSASVTIRILRYRQIGTRVEATLHRIASSPHPVGSEQGERIFVTGHNPNLRGQPEYWRTSLNAYVAFLGKPVYLYNLDKSFSVQGADGLKSILSIPGRPLAKSTICLPLVVDGSLIGTMNLESPFENAYSHLKNSITAFSKLAEVILAMTRQRIGHELSAATAPMGLSAHDLFHLEADLHGIRSTVHAAGVDADFGPLLSRLQPLPSPVDRVPKLDSTLELVIEQVLANRRRLEKVVPAVDIRVSVDIRVPGANVESTAKVFDELLENVAIHHDYNDLTTTPTVRNTRFVVGGVSYDAIYLENVARVPPSALAISRLYSTSIDFGDRRPHLGCYTIGQLVRSMGGVVYATTEQDDPVGPTIFRTTVLLPRTT